MSHAEAPVSTGLRLRLSASEQSAGGLLGSRPKIAFAARFAVILAAKYFTIKE